MQRSAIFILSITLLSTRIAACSARPSSRTPELARIPHVEIILTALDNPRGIAVGPAGELFVSEAGTGFDAVDPTEMTGKFTVFMDRNGDGDFDDEGEADRWFSHLPTYNALQFFGTRRDEVSGPSDVLIHDDGRVFLSVDGGLDKIGLFEISPEARMGRNLSSRSNMNSIAFTSDQESVYAVESTLNQLVEITLQGELREIVAFTPLDSGQQAVPAGVAVDPSTGEVLVALFSGVALDKQTGEIIPFVPGDAKVVRVNPDSGQVIDEITGLTAAVDVAVDSEGMIFVVEMASGYADLLPKLFDLFDAGAPPLHGGYLRFSGRVTSYPADGGSPTVILEGIDMPTNITVGPQCELYVSTGQGTPGRPIPGSDGPTRIVGQVLRVTNLPVEVCG
ncbi:MAG: SMP-30/gluconolactonase/LRE family protein [Anaerolineales bacterium]